MSTEVLGDADGEETLLNVLDLPQLYTRPNAKVLLAILDDLSLQPHSWDFISTSDSLGTGSHVHSATATLRRRRKINQDGVPQYLTRIISSPLSWIEDDEEKELIWDNASQRLSERSGRTAMGAISRTFVIPAAQMMAPLNGMSTPGQLEISKSTDAISIMLHEPALTADNLGLKTWASSFLLAKRLSLIKAHLPLETCSSIALELGSGTGLVGIAAAAILATDIILTDLPEIVPNLERNIRDNAAIFAKSGGQACAAILDWRTPEMLTTHGLVPGPAQFPLILAADIVYDAEQPALAAQAIDYHLVKGLHARVVIEIPLREGFAAEREDFRRQMSKINLRIVDEGEETGVDDWGSGHNVDDMAEVRCWWSVWARK